MCFTGHDVKALRVFVKAKRDKEKQLDAELWWSYAVAAVKRALVLEMIKKGSIT